MTASNVPLASTGTVDHSFSHPCRSENKCTAKAEAEWTGLGCAFKYPRADTVPGLGTHRRIVPTTSCEVSCPVGGQDFVVTSATG